MPDNFKNPLDLANSLIKGGRFEVPLKSGKKVWIDTNYDDGFQVAGYDGFGNYNPWQRMLTDNSDGVHSFVKGYETIKFNTPSEALDYIKKQYGDDSFDSGLYDQVKDWKRDQVVVQQTKNTAAGLVLKLKSRLTNIPLKVQINAKSMTNYTMLTAMKTLLGKQWANLLQPLAANPNSLKNTQTALLN